MRKWTPTPKKDNQASVDAIAWLSFSFPIPFSEPSCILTWVPGWPAAAPGNGSEEMGLTLVHGDFSEGNSDRNMLENKLATGTLRKSSKPRITNPCLLWWNPSRLSSWGSSAFIAEEPLPMNQAASIHLGTECTTSIPMCVLPPFLCAAAVPRFPLLDLGHYVFREEFFKWLLKHVVYYCSKA